MVSVRSYTFPSCPTRNGSSSSEAAPAGDAAVLTSQESNQNGNEDQEEYKHYRSSSHSSSVFGVKNLSLSIDNPKGGHLISLSSSIDT
jgi:hypothetical protein